MLTGIRLKYSILRSAVKGLLVSQNKGDEPASVLIERARVEKSVSEPKGRGRSKVNSVIYRDKDNPKAFYEWANESYVADVTDELPFEIPDSWEWARLGSFARLKAGNTIPDADLMRMQTGGLYPCYGGNGIRGYAETYNREGRYIAIGRQGALCGNIHLFEGKFYATEHCILAMIFGGTSLDWFAYMLEGLDLNNSMSSTAQPGLAVRDLNKVLIPVPPLEEQIRIEEKVRKLLALADEFTECERRRQETDAEFPGKLRRSVVREAVRGRLGTGNPSESASDLRKRISETKLIPAKKSKMRWPESFIYRDPDDPTRFLEKQGNHEPEDITDSIPFDIPPNWEWARLRDIACGHGFMTPTEKFSHIEIGNIDNIKHKLYEPLPVRSPEIYPGSKKITRLGDILVAMVRPNLKNICMIEKEYEFPPFACFSIIVLGCHELMLNRYVFTYLLSPDFDNYANQFDTSRGTSIPTIKETTLLAALIPIPPREEQERIVKKLDEMLLLIQEFVDKRVELHEKSFEKAKRRRIKELEDLMEGKKLDSDLGSESKPDPEI